MARYSLIATDMWYDKEFRKLEPKGKLLYIYLLTSPHCNQSGFYRLPIDIVELEVRASDLIVCESHLWTYDKDNEVVFIPSYLKYNTSKSMQQLKALSNSISSLPCTPLIVDFFSAYIKHCSQDLSIFSDYTMKMLDYQLELRNDKKAELIKYLINK